MDLWLIRDPFKKKSVNFFVERQKKRKEKWKLSSKNEDKFIYILLLIQGHDVDSNNITNNDEENLI